MEKSVAVFIDGQNLFHSLKDIDIKLSEEGIDFIKIIGSGLEEGEKIKSIHLFRPERMTHMRIRYRYIAQREIKRMFKTDPDKMDRFLKEIAREPKDEEILKLLPRHIAKHIKNEFYAIVNWYNNEKDRFSRVASKYKRLSEEYPNFYIEKKGELKVNPYKFEMQGEKGVDVALALKMAEMAWENYYDKAILFTGDSDHIETIKICQKNKKIVSIARFLKGIPPQNVSTAQALIDIANTTFDIHENDLKTTFQKGVTSSSSSSHS